MGEIIVSELTESQIDRINVILNEVPAPKPVEPKPVEQKIIDLTMMVGADVDTEFTDNVILNEVPAPKPVEQKIIDLTKMVGSDVDMEFGKNALVIGKLTDIEECSDHVKYFMNHKQTGWYHQCRIRQNHIHYYDGRENPLPDGLLVKLYFSNYTPTTYKSQNIDWVDMFFCLHNIKGFEVLEVLPEYKYGWEK